MLQKLTVLIVVIVNYGKDHRCSFVLNNVLVYVILFYRTLVIIGSNIVDEVG